MATTLLPSEIVENKIYFIRGRKVMIDRDLALLYGVLTKNFNKAVRRNLDRFPEDFMFTLTQEEVKSLRFQSAALKRGEHSKYLPMAFTEQGIAMLSGVLRSSRAVQVNISIMRAFVKLRELMMTHKDLARKIEELETKFNKHDENFIVIFQAIKKLLQVSREPNKKKPPIGFRGA